MAYPALVVPVPELEHLVRPRLAQRPPRHLFPVGGEPGPVHAHITLLAPFGGQDGLEEGVLAELRTFFADVTGFSFALTGVGASEGGATYLTPEPATPFRRLTQELIRRFPEYPPFGGGFDDVVPHLSLPVPPGKSAEDLRRELAPHLPVTAHAREAVLFWFEPGAFRVIERFPFGTSAA